jgi:hypothetical protein
MKQIIKLLSIVFILLIIISSCKNNSGKKEILASKIQYDVPVVSNDPQLDWWINNLEGSKRDPFIKRIYEAAEKGDVRVYDYFNKPLAPDQVKLIGIDTIYQVLKRTRPPYEEYDTTIITSMSYKDVTKIRYMEEWKWDPKTLEIEKKVLAIGPVINREFGGMNYSQLMFWVALDKSFPGK